MSKSQRTYPNEPIAIIGSGCRFPGEASTPSRLWDLLREPRDVQSEIPEHRFNPDGFYHPVNDHHGTSNIRHSYLLSEEHRHFDAQFFGIKPVEANSIDPQQRMLLEVVFESVEAAGLSIDVLRGSPTAVYVGLMCADYADLLGRDTSYFPTYFATGTARSIISNRVSYFFDWRGPSMTIDTACSSSLVAVHQAVQLLRSGESRVAVAAGANLLLGPEQYIAESNLKMLSPTGRSHMWSEKADGYARGEGIASVVLKTLSAALEDGDDIECLIVETGINQDGRTKGITMPSAMAQATLIEATYRKAGLDLRKASDRPQYFEAHGTGTPAGDPIEAEAISTAFFKNNSPDCITNPLFVGSIKTVIGHTEGTAGLAGLLKASLALKHHIIPPNLLFESLAPAVKPFYSNLEIATRARPWPTTEQNAPPRASLNSFGFGGANAHCILESYTAHNLEQDMTTSIYTPFTFSAVSEKALIAVIASYADFIRNKTSIDLRALSRTLSERRTAFPVRVSISAADASSLLSKLDNFAEGHGEKIIMPVTPSSFPIRVLGIFTGQGSQWAGMASKLMHSRAVIGILDDLERSLSELTDHPPQWSLKAELLADKSVSRIGEAAFSQPACTAVQIILVQLLRAAGITFSAVVGHSSGEIGAAYAAGYLTASDAIRIAYYRGVHLRLAQGKNGEPGTMLAVGTSFEDAKSFCGYKRYRGKVCVAASNSATSVTLSGDASSIESIRVVFEEEKKFARMLKVDKAYHSHHMTACSAAYMQSLRACGIKACRPSQPDCLWVSSVYQRDIAEVEDNLNDSYWNSNLVSPVLFSQALEYALGESKFDFAVEVGPHPAMKGPASQVIQDALGDDMPYTGLLSRNMDDIEALANGLGFLWASMSEPVVNFSAYDSFLSERPVPGLLKDLPKYPWDHKRAYWHESRISKSFRARGTNHELLGVRTPNHSDDHLSWTNYLIPRELPWVPGHCIQGQMVFPAAGYISTAFEAARELAGPEIMQLIKLTDFTIGQPVVFDADDSSVEILVSLTEVRRQGARLLARFGYYSIANKEPGPMILNASGTLQIIFGEPNVQALRPLPEPEFALMEVDHDRFYDSFASYGYGYTGPFKALTSMERKLGVATGVIKVPEATSLKRLLIHPAPLDAAIQSILLAYCFPGDGRLVSIQLPTDVSSITINPAQALCAATEQSLKFVSSISHDDGKRIEGDVDLYPEDGSRALIQLEGLHTRPMVPPTESSDAKIFSEMIWDVSSPNAMLLNSAAEEENFDFGFILERVAYYYLRNLIDSTDAEDRKNCEWYHKSLFDFADTMISRVADGSHPYANKEWINDTHRDILDMLERHPTSIDLRIMRAVGENILSVVRSETSTILEPMMKDNMLNDFYVTGLGMKEYLAKLTATAKQIGHRYPAMNVLEIGAGTGGATKSILRELDEAFASYTYTDISSGFFEKAKEVFKGRESKMSFKTLDIEKDVIEQGYAENSYDLIIASLVLHATSKLDDTMKNVRRLLKPGGYLLMLEITDNEQMRFGFIFGGLPGWWLGHEDGRALSPCIEAPTWDKLLKEYGFSGVDSIAPHKTSEPLPLCVMLGQAIDERIDFLRNPLSSPGANFDLPQLTIIGGSTLHTAGCLSGIGNLLGCSNTDITEVISLENLTTTDLLFGGTVVCLQDHDNPVFENLNATKLDGLQKLFERSKHVLWVTRGYKQGDPYAKMIVAFARCLVQEMSHVQVQFLDLPVSSALEPTLISECLLRFVVVDHWEDQGRLTGILWSTESEISHEHGQHYIPRVKLNKTLNNRYNSARRRIVEAVNPNIVPVTLTSEGEDFTIKGQSSLVRVKSCTNPGEVQVLVSHSILTAVKIGSLGYFYLILGKIAESGAQVIALSNALSSKVNIPSSLIRLCSGNIDQVHAHLLATFYSLISLTALWDLSSGDLLVALDPDESLIHALNSAAAVRGIEVRILIDAANSEELMTSKANASHIFGRSILAVTEKNISRVLCWSDNEWTSKFCQKLGSKVAVEKFDTCVSFSASQVSPNRTFRASEILDQARTQSFSTEFFGGNANVVYRSLADVKKGSLSKPIVTLIDWTASLSVPMTLEPVDARALFRNDMSYWLVGLTGGLGLSLCRWMITRGARHIAISSRNPKIDDRWFDEFKSLGATVKVYANDVTDRTSVRATYAKIQSDLPTIVGVCQGAMVLQDTLFMDLDMQRMEKVLKPKVDGATYLNEIFQRQPLDFFIMLSSMAAVTGNPGQAAYAAANMFLAGLAAQRRQKGLAASTVNIGAIIGNGYVTRELTLTQQVALQKVGNMWMSEQDFYQIFAEAVIASPSRPGPSPEYCTGLRVFYADEDNRPKFANDPVFSHLMLHRNLAGPIIAGNVASLSVKAQLLQANSPDEIHEIMKGSLLAKLQTALQTSPDIDMIGLSADALGIDSLVAVDLRSWFLKELSVDMSVLKIISGATIGELLARAQELLDPALTPGLGAEISAEKKAAMEKAKPSSQQPKSSTKADQPVPKVDATSKPQKQIESSHMQPLTPQDSVRSTPSSMVQSPQPIDVAADSTAEYLANPFELAPIAMQDKASVAMTQQQVGAVVPTPKASKHVDRPIGNTMMKLISSPDSSELAYSLSEKKNSYMPLDRNGSSGSLGSSSSSVKASSISQHTPDQFDVPSPVPSSRSSMLSSEHIFSATANDAGVSRIVPMSFSQARFWFLRSYLEDSTTFNVTASIHLQGKLRVDDFAQAVTIVGQRHESLRTRFFMDDKNQPMQAILDHTILSLERKTVDTSSDVATEFDRLRNHVYNLEKGETMRIVILELSPISHQILLGYHHINMDGVSFEIFFSDLEQAYNSGSAITAPVTQYPDFAIKQRQEFTDGKWNNELKYWKKEFADLPPALPLLPLSSSTARSSLTKYDSHLTSFRVTSQLSAQISETCKKMKVSPFQFYLTIYKVFITRFVDVDDFCIGVADANRNDPEQQNSLGCYLNLLPIRFDNHAVTFSEAVKETKSKVQQAYAHSKVPFEVILKELSVPRSSHHSPLFQIFLNYRRGVAEKRTFAGCDSQWDDFDGGQIAYDLSLDIVDNAGGDALLRLFAQTELYTAEDTAILMKSFVNLLDAFSQNAAARLIRPSIHSKDDTQKALTLGRGKLEYPQRIAQINSAGLTNVGPRFDLKWQGTLVHRIDDIARRFNNSLALKDGLGSQLTYDQMTGRVNVIARALLSASNRHNSFVGVFQEPSTDWICSLLAIMRVGAVYVPLDSQASTMRLATIIEDCKLTAIIVDNSMKQFLPELKFSGDIINVSLLRSSRDGVDIPNVSGEDTAMTILYTSGSTGKPKGIEMKHSTVRAHVETVTSEWISDSKDLVGLQQSSFSFDMSLVQIFWPLCSGGSVFVAPRSARGDPVAISRILTSENVTLTAATPSEYSSWIEYGDSDAVRLSPWSLAIAGGEMVSESLVQAFQCLAIPALRLINCYGPTEITFFSHFAEAKLGKDQRSHLELRPWFNVSSYAVDSNLNPLPIGVPGEIVIGGMGVASGYFNQPETSNKRFVRDSHASSDYAVRGWTMVHLSGDRGRLTTNGTLLLEGRVVGDTQVKLRGLRIDLQEIEANIIQHSRGAILHAIVSVRQLGESTAEVLVGHVELSPLKKQDDSFADIVKLLHSLPVPQYMRPSLFIPVDKLPRTESGKLNRLAIKAAPIRENPQTEALPNNLGFTESRLLQIWQDVLTKEMLDNFAVDSESDFFQVGGTSLLLVTLRARIQEAFDLDIPLVQLFDISTFGRMTAKIHYEKDASQTISSTNVQSPVKEVIPESNYKEAICWESETSVPTTLVPATVLGLKEPRVVVMTGTTGFLGKAILQLLIATSSIEKIYCIAVRPDYSQIDPVFASPKVIVCKGDQKLPLLGLSSAEITPMLTGADTIIHNGADVSFLKSYQSLRSVNVSCTQQLADWAVEYGLQFHYISTASIANLTERESYPPISVRDFPPATDGSNGYIASKWASEMYLEGINAMYHMPLVIHRPSSITGPGVPETDLMSSLFKYSRQMLGIPQSPNFKGWIDLISLETAAAMIVSVVQSGHEELEVKYIYESGEVQIKSDEMKQSMEVEFPGKTIQEMTIDEWVKRAEVLGMNGLVAAFMIGMKDQPFAMTKPERDVEENNVQNPPQCARKKMGF